jgi:hypothetical protein
MKARAAVSPNAASAPSAQHGPGSAGAHELPYGPGFQFRVNGVLHWSPERF